MKFITFSLFCICIGHTIAPLQAKDYAGRVFNSETDSGVAGVSVTLRNSSGKATTDALGRFSFSAEVSVKSTGFMNRNRAMVLLRNADHSINLKAVPEVTALLLYTLKGELLFYKVRTPGTDLLSLPELPKSIYLLRLATRSGESVTVKWVHMGADVLLPTGTFSGKNGILSKQLSIISDLVFEKQGYQTKQVAIDSDSTYSAMSIKMKPEIGYRIFDEDTVRTYRLSITAQNMATLLDYSSLVTNGYTVNSVVVPARLLFEGRVLDTIGVRFRGDQSLWDCVSNGARKKDVKYPQYGFGNTDICAKFSMKFDFNKFDDNQRLLGLKALNFRSMSADPTKMHEKLGFSLFNDMGIASPRVAYAKLYVNDSLWGLFGIAEEIDGRFTKSRYPKSGDGNLYKDLWPEEEASDGVISDALETNNDPTDNPNISDFREFRDIVTATGTTEGNFAEKCRTIVDLAYLVRYLVVDRGIMNFDGIMSCYSWPGGHMRHNYCWYHDDESGLFKLIPWDLDKVFLYPEPNFWTNNEANGNNVVPNWNVVNSTYSSFRCTFDPGSGGGSYNVDAIDKDPFLRLLRGATWNDFCNQGRVFLDSVFTRTKIDARIGKWHTLIAGAVGEDPTIDSTEWEIMVDSLSRSVPLFRKNLEMMIDTLIVE